MNTSARIQDFDGDYDPFTAMLKIGREESVTDVYSELRRLRRQSSVHDIDLRDIFKVPRDATLTDQRGVTVLGYEKVKEVLGDPGTYSSTINDRFLGLSFGRSVTTMDAPEHTRYRRIFQKAFLPSMIEQFREVKVPAVINALIDNFADRGSAELVESFTRYFAFNFIHELLELPLADRQVFHRLAVGQLAISYDPPRGEEATEKLRTYLEQLIAERRESPVSDHDFIHATAHAEVEGERLPDEVVVAFFRQLMNAGGDTSYHGLGNILAALLTHPEQLDAVRQDRSLVLKAIDEGLRWNCPVLTVFRNPTRPVTLDGVEIGHEDYLNVVLGSANRDDAHWPDADKFDIFREEQRHFAFGQGSHVCIGQHLARMEMTVAINALLDRLPDLRLDPDHPAPTVHGLILRGPDELHVRFG